MPKIEVEVMDMTGIKRKKLKLPDNIEVKHLLPKLIKTLHLPTVGPDKQPIVYQLYNRTLGRSLSEDETLREAIVRKGDSLRIRPVITAGGLSVARQRRLESDYKKMLQLKENSTLIDFVVEDNIYLPEKYLITFKCKGLIWDEKFSKPKESFFHQVRIYLTAEYPRKPPQISWLTPIFHPNISGGVVCLGSWSPQESLDMLCIKLAEMIQYKNYAEKDALNEEAALWARSNKNNLPIDKTQLLDKIR